MRSRNGFTLVEMLVAVVILGLLVLIGFPKISSALVRNELRGARTTMVNMVAKARAAAVQSNRRTWIKIEGDRAYVIASPRLNVGAGDVDTVGSVQDFGDFYKVGLATDANPDSIQFDPRGIGGGFGLSKDIVLTRGDYSSTITIDGLGRVTK